MSYVRQIFEQNFNHSQKPFTDRTVTLVQFGSGVQVLIETVVYFDVNAEYVSHEFNGVWLNVLNDVVQPMTAEQINLYLEAVEDFHMGGIA